MAKKWFGREPVTFAGRLSHIAFIMDGNGRWATRRSLPREAGHKQGAARVRDIVDAAGRFGIEHVTLYAFSTENWKRPQHEVDALMGLISSYIDELLTNLPPVRIRFIGDKSPLSPELCEKIREIEGKTAHYPRTLNIAVNYGGRAELCHAFNLLIAEGRQEVTEDDISAHLYTAPIPDPDLIIRTGGDKRTSNFLLWQAAYAELAFTKTLWPDFTERELFAILKDFCKRHRRFGGL
jgi:undecaprenyl diphosphate synthase